MGTYIRGLPDPVEGFVMAFWDTDVRAQVSSSTAREVMWRAGSEAGVRAFLLEVIYREAASPEEWRKLVNVKAWTPEDVRRDAQEFWMWLYDGAEVPKESSGSGTMHPPQV